MKTLVNKAKADTAEETKIIKAKFFFFFKKRIVHNEKKGYHFFM